VKAAGLGSASEKTMSLPGMHASQSLGRSAVYAAVAARPPASLRGGATIQRQAAASVQAPQRRAGDRGRARVPPAKASRAVRSTIQRNVNGFTTMQQVAHDDETWGVYSLLTNAERTQFRASLPGANDDFAYYRQQAQININAWFVANIANVAANAPGMIQVGLQNVGQYGYPNLLRFRWFGVAGPNGTTINTVGINLHRGPQYAGLGSAWCKMSNALTFELNPAQLLGGVARGALVTQLENYAAAGPTAQIRTMANNANCP
jgi:hypothetical protein